MVQNNVDQYPVIRWLNPSGWIAAILMAAVIVALGSYQLLLSPILFFIVGSLLSKLNSSNSEKEEGPRNWKQVLANGGLAIVLVSLMKFSNEPQTFLSLYHLVFAVSLSDTTSSEVGKYFRGKTIDILTFKSTKVGLSGGISFQGTFAGMIIAIVFARIVVFLSCDMDAKMYFIVFWACVGMFIDSVLGSLIQAKYIENGTMVERGSKENLSKGVHGIDNDVVNFLTGLTTIILAYLFF